MSDEVESQPRAYTIRLELVDEPGELLRALEPISAHGGNLLSIFHERGNITPRGHIPVEIDLECPPGRFDTIVAGLREAGVNVIQAGEDRFGEELVVLLVGDPLGTDLSDTVASIEDRSSAAVIDLALAASADDRDGASARLRIAAERGSVDEALAAVHAVADRKGLSVIEPVGLEGEP